MVAFKAFYNTLFNFTNPLIIKLKEKYIPVHLINKAEISKNQPHAIKS